MNLNTKKVLILSVAPVPTPESRRVEGGGQRAWALAKGLLLNGIDVTVSVPAHFATELKEHDGITLESWYIGDELKRKINNYDSVIILYSRGDLTRFVVENIDDQVQLIVDLYVPIYVEVSARNKDATEEDYVNYMRDIDDWNMAFIRGDVFLSAHETQTIFYTGVLAAFGRINPINYYEKLLLEVPLGFENKPTQTQKDVFKGVKVDKEDFVILWFGGLYPWFNIENLIEAVADLNKKNPKIKLLIIGAKNPFNDHPDFNRQYEKILRLCQDNSYIDRSVFFVDWVDYEDLSYWFKSADVVVSINEIGEENKYSWRTRIVELTGSGVPILTNGGDPLSEKLIERDAAIKLDSNDYESIYSLLEKVTNDRKILKKTVENLSKFRPTLFVEKVTKDLALYIKEGFKASDLKYRKKRVKTVIPLEGNERIIGKLKLKYNRFINSISENGLIPTAKKYLNKFMNRN